MSTFEIRYSSTAEQSLYSQISHLQPYVGNGGAEEKLSRLILQVEVLLSKNPSPILSTPKPAFSV
jgi:hypothetical protein